MVEIKVKLQVNAPTEKVWDIVSDVDNDSQFWNGIKAIRNISKEENFITREVTKGKVNKFLQTVTLFPKEGLNVHWTKGSITGTKDIILTPLGNTTVLEVHINYKFSGMTSLLSGYVTRDLQREAEDALQLIKAHAEGNSSQSVMVERKFWSDLVNEKLERYD